MKLPLPLADAMQSGWHRLQRLATVTPREPKLTVGMDIGSSSIKLVALGPRKPGGGRPILGQRLVPLQGSSDEQVTAAIKEAAGGLGLPVSAVNLSVCGQSVIMRVVEMPVLSPGELAQALPFEAQRHLPFQIQDVVLDGTLLGTADASQGKKMWVLIVACKRDLLEQRVACLKQAGLEPALVDVDALALANAFTASANGNAHTGTQALINIGAQWTNLVILKGGVPYLVRDIPWGSQKLAHEMAEQLNRDAGAVAAQLQQPAPAGPEWQDAMKMRCESFTTDLQLSFDFFESRFGTTPERILVSGGLTQCPGFMDALKSHLVQPLELWTVAGGLNPQFLVAYGLALRTSG